MFTLEGRTCVFAGATGHIGEGAVRAMCQAGMNVVMITHSPERAQGMIDSLGEYKHRCIALSNEKGDDALFGEIAERFGSVDVVINKTGGFSAPVAVEDINPEDLSKKLNHQIMGSFKMAQAALPFLKQSKAGRIIFMASAGAQDGFTGENMCDSIARAGVINMTYCMARQLAGTGITVNCVAASGIVNDHPPRGPEHFDSASIQHLIPVGRIGTNDEFGAAVAYLASEEAGFVTGQVINLSGGLHIG